MTNEEFINQLKLRRCFSTEQIASILSSWWDLANQPAQEAFLKDWWSQECLYVGGLGSGKTFAGALKFVILTCINRSSGLIVAPTYSDIQRVVIPKIKEVCEWLKIPFYNAERGTVNHRFNHILIGGIPNYVISADTPERFAGFEVSHIWVDEAARIKTSNNPLNDGPTQIRSRMRSITAVLPQMILTTTPEGVDSWIQKDFFEIDQNQLKDAKRAWYIGSTRLNKALPDFYIKNLETAYSPEMQKQYLDGIATSFAMDVAHPMFTDENIREFPIENPTSQKVYIGIDFNRSPLCAIAAIQIRPENGIGQLWVFDELIIEENATVKEAVELMHDKHFTMSYRGPENKIWDKEIVGWNNLSANGKIVFCPDKSCKQHRVESGSSALEIMESTAKSLGWRCTFDADGNNPDVNDRIHLVSMKIKHGEGDLRLFVSPRCKRLIKELKTTGRQANGKYDTGKGKEKGKRGHILDALGYICWHIYGDTYNTFKDYSAAKWQRRP